MISHPDLDEIIHFKSIDSTNLELKRRRDEFQGRNILMVSDEQTKGQGQKGRKWESASEMGLWMSLHLGKSHCLVHNLKLLSLYTGMIVQKIISPSVATQVRLKWPNDIMIGAKKCGGILTELQWQGEAVTSAIIGVGINLHQTRSDFPNSIQEMATSLRLAGFHRPDRGMLAQAFVDEFMGGLSQLDSDKQLVSEWNKLAYMLHQTIVWETLERSISGEFYGVNQRGDALIKIDGELKTFRTGEIRLNESS